MKKILIIRTGGTFAAYAQKHKDFEHWTADGMGLADNEWQCVNVRAGESLPDPSGYAGCAITGSHDMVTDDIQWIHDTRAWVAEAVMAGLPMLGICFGHQLMADALGGHAGYHPDGLEIGTAEITLTPAGKDDPLFAAMPLTFKGHVTHSQTALELPPGAAFLATGTHDPHQAFRVGDHAWGVQFHPEFDEHAIAHYIDQLRDKIVGQGGNVGAIADTVVATPESAGVLKRFADYCRKRG